jgi:hypothetical protein
MTGFVAFRGTRRLSRREPSFSGIFDARTPASIDLSSRTYCRCIQKNFCAFNIAVPVSVSLRAPVS